MKTPPRRVHGIDTMRTASGHDDDADIRRMFEAGSSSWVGPMPRASESRWSRAHARGRGFGRAVKLAGVGVGFTVLIFGTVTLAASAGSPGGPGASMTRLMSQLRAGVSETPAAREQPPVGNPSPGVPGTGDAALGAATSATQKPRPMGTTESEATRSGSIRPGPTPTVSAPPTPGPSGPHDE